MKPTPEQIAKLPRWAQDHLNNISRERDAAIRSLNEFCDNQSPSPFYIEDHPCTGETSGPSRKRIYIQAHAITVEWAGVILNIDANDYGNRKNEIEISWSTAEGTRDVAMVPRCFNAVIIKTKENMR